MYFQLLVDIRGGGALSGPSGGAEQIDAILGDYEKGLFSYTHEFHHCNIARRFEPRSLSDCGEKNHNIDSSIGPRLHHTLISYDNLRIIECEELHLSLYMSFSQGVTA
jgi:hypothetical protein